MSLYMAACEGRVEVVQYLAEQGADVDKADNKGGSPLQKAAGKGHLMVVRTLVEHGADKDKADNDGMTPLFLEALGGIRCRQGQGEERRHHRTSHGSADGS